MRPFLLLLWAATLLPAAEPAPQWLRLSGELRSRVEGRTGYGYQPGNNDNYAIFRERFNVELAPAPWLIIYTQFQDARVAGLDDGRTVTPFRNPVDLRQAYVRFGGPKSLLKLTAGRQLFNYGAQRLIGAADWVNTARAWDALKLEIGTPDTKVDVFASSVVVNDPARRIDRHRNGMNLHGAYGSLRKAVPRAVFEPYLLWKTGNQSIFTGGMRLAAMPGTPGLRGFDYQTEWARQWGTFGLIRHSAWAGYAISGYSIPGAPWRLRTFGEYSHASGDRTPGQGTRRTFDHLMGTNHLHYGLTDPIGWQNMRMTRFGADASPNKRLQWMADYRWLWLDSAADALFDIGGRAIVRPKAGNTARAVGTEIDLSGTYALSPKVRVGGGVGHLFAGAFLKQNSRGSGQTFPYLFAQYSF